MKRLIKERLKVLIISILRKYDVKKAAVFGSMATGKATKGSDLDLVIEFNGKKNLLDLAGLKMELEEELGRDVDVVTYNSLHPLLKDKILKEQKMIL